MCVFADSSDQEEGKVEELNCWNNHSLREMREKRFYSRWVILVTNWISSSSNNTDL